MRPRMGGRNDSWTSILAQGETSSEESGLVSAKKWWIRIKLVHLDENLPTERSVVGYVDSVCPGRKIVGVESEVSPFSIAFDDERKSAGLFE